jgi:peptide/nickel transport system substrate-binding protein
VKFTINTVLVAGGAMARFVQGISNVQTPDNYTVVVTTSQPTLWAGWLTGLDILPEHYWVAHGAVGAAALNFTNNPPIGSGPFQLVNWVPGEYMQFKANDNFFMGRPKIDTLIIRQYATAEDLLAALKTGEVDADGYIPNSDVPGVQGMANLTILWTPEPIVQDIYINVNNNHSQGNPTLLDKNVRLALSYAINRTYLNDELYQGHWQNAVSFIPPMFGPYFCTECQSMVPQFNLTKANQILDQAGYKRGSDGIRVSPSGVRLSYRFYIYNGYPEMVRGAQFIRQWWNQIGVDVTYQAMEGGSLWTIISSPPFNWDLALWDWEVNDAPSQIYSYTTPAIAAGYSSSGLSDPAFDAMYQTITTTTNQTLAISTIHQVQMYMIQNAVEIPTFYETQAAGYYSNKWTGIQDSPTGALDPGGLNALMYLYLQPVSASTTSGTAPATTNSTAAAPPPTSSGWTIPLAVVVIIVLLAAAIYMRRKRSPESVKK